MSGQRIYPCSHTGCTVMRSKDEGGTVFTVCDEHWIADVKMQASSQPLSAVALQSEVERLRTQLSTTRAALAEAERERDRLFLLINTPRTDDFFEAVRIEAAHQVERWGVEHDAGKRPEDWITLCIYLLGKAAKAHFDGDREKLLHHVVTAAAVALNWHRNVTGVSTAMRPGVAEVSP